MNIRRLHHFHIKRMGEVEEERTLSIKVHPLVVLNISQHFTRIRSQYSTDDEPTKAPIVVGALMGKLTARTIDIRDWWNYIYYIRSSRSSSESKKC